MFAIAVEQDQYKTYVLSDQAAQSQVTVVPERGGIISTWQYQNQDILYLDRERFANPARSVRGGIPLLFPICGNLPEDTYTDGEQVFQLKQHGFARDLPWEVTDQSTDGSARLTLRLKSSDITRAYYPFDFELTYTYQLRGNSLELFQNHTNLASEPMPFSTGIHPYFLAPEKSQLAFAIPATQFQAKDEATEQTFTGTFDFEQDEIDIAFLNLSGQFASVTDQSRDLKLTLEFDTNYSTLVFWTVKGKDFYCLEPWSSPRNAMNTGQHLLNLEPGASVTTVVKLGVELGEQAA